MNSNRKQLRVELPEDDLARLRDLCAERGVSVVEAMRRGAWLYIRAVDAVTPPLPKRGRPRKEAQEAA